MNYVTNSINVAKSWEVIMKIETEIMFGYKNHGRVEGDYVREENNSKVNLGSRSQWAVSDAKRSAVVGW